MQAPIEKSKVINRTALDYQQNGHCPQSHRTLDLEAPSLTSGTRTLSRRAQPCPLGRACRLMQNFLDGRGLPQVNPVIGLRFWPEAENRFRSFERVDYTSSASRKCREEKSVENGHWLPNSSLKGAV
jgi:hypothetical protein